MKKNENFGDFAQNIDSSVLLDNYDCRVTHDGITECMSMATFAAVGNYYLVCDLVDELVQSPSRIIIYSFSKNATRYTIKVSPKCLV